MDPVHIVIIVVTLFVGFALGVFARVGFRDLRERSEKDEAIDAATFLALRQLEEYVRSTKQPSGKPS
jgi:phosphate uptake regulator